MKTAVLGMGRMGAALAGRLLAGGHEVLVWNRSPGKATDVVKAGAVEAGSLAEAVKAAEVVLTCLSNDAAVRHVALGDGGVRGSIADGVPYIECSTVSPQLTDELAGMFDHFAAVPVLGGPAAIESGQATYLVGTGPQTLELIEPALASLGGAVRYYEMAGLASTAKLTVNLMLLSGVAALAESFTVGRSGGLHDDQLRELLGEAVAPGLKNRFEALLGAPAAGWWTTVLGAKDAGLAIDVAEGAGIHLQVAPAVRQAYLRAAEQGHGDEDIAAVRYLYRS
jgi:3-hydroxyisobutyrate dehydrogenase